MTDHLATLPLATCWQWTRALAAIVLLLVLPTTLTAENIPQVYADLMVFRENTTQSITYTEPGVYRLHAPAVQCAKADPSAENTAPKTETSHDLAQRVALLPDESPSLCFAMTAVYWQCPAFQQHSLAPICPPPEPASTQRF